LEQTNSKLIWSWIFPKETDLPTLASTTFFLSLELDRLGVIFFQNLQNTRKHKNNTKYKIITKPRD
jgi:hypothetical protein